MSCGQSLGTSNLAALATITASCTAIWLTGSPTVFTSPARNPAFSSSLMPLGEFFLQYLVAVMVVVVEVEVGVVVVVLVNLVVVVETHLSTPFLK